MRIISKTVRVLSRYGWASILIILAAFAVGFTWSSSDKLYTNIRLFDRVALMISQNYVEDIDEMKMIRAAIDGMLAKLDNFTRFLDDADYAYLKQETDGHFDGVGVQLEYHRDTLTVISVLEGGPAYRVGVKPGDRILAIDSTSAFGASMKEVRMPMRGPKGSRVSLRIWRPGEQEYEIVIKRDDVELKPIPYYCMISENIGYIRLARFSETCSEQLRSAIRDLSKRGMQSLILDLRDNPGGLLLEAIEVASLFLPVNSDIVTTQGQNSSSVNNYTSYDAPIFPDGNLAILVDDHTASAAEIVAGAIQDHDRGIIIGTSTFGKGLIQQVLQISDESALKITTSKYFLPSGRCLQKPDWSTFELIGENLDRQSDSLFATDAGRSVIAEGGIIPDIYIDDLPKSEYIEALTRESCFFDFATAYLKNHGIGRDFVVDDELLSEFKEFIVIRGSDYQEKDRVQFNEFRENLSVLDDETLGALEILDRKLALKETWRFDSHRMEIARSLKEAILLQAFDETAIYREFWIAEHPQIKEAVSVLADREKYNSILASR